MLGMAIWRARTGPYRSSTITTVATKSSSREIPTSTGSAIWPGSTTAHKTPAGGRRRRCGIRRSSRQLSLLICRRPLFLRQTIPPSWFSLTVSGCIGLRDTTAHALNSILPQNKLELNSSACLPPRSVMLGKSPWLTELLRAATIVWSGTRIMWPLVEW